MIDESIRDRARGALLGLACGDALGAQVEFMARGTFPEQRDMTGDGPHRLLPGQWTDDTAMALALAEHLAMRRKRVAPAILARTWVNWYREGEYSCTGKCFDIGNQTRAALEVHERSRPGPIPMGLGNGSLMRTAPIGIKFNINLGLVPIRDNARLQSNITHPAPLCGDICAYFSTLISYAIYVGSSPQEIVNRVTSYPDYLVTRMNELSEKDIRSGGYVLDTLEAALWCVWQSTSPEEAICRAVNLGDDADTTGAVAGALAGAIWGASRLPARWLDVLAWRERLTNAADNLLLNEGKLA